MATAAIDPLEQLGSRIAEAKQLPEPEPYVTTADPMAALRSRLRGEDAEPANTNTASSPAPSTSPSSMPAAGGDLATLVGQEVLQMVASRPLPAEAREEAVRRLSIALQNPSTDNIRSVLAVLVTGRTDA